MIECHWCNASAMGVSDMGLLKLVDVSFFGIHRSIIVNLGRVQGLVRVAVGLELLCNFPLTPGLSNLVGGISNETQRFANHRVTTLDPPHDVSARGLWQHLPWRTARQREQGTPA